MAFGKSLTLLDLERLKITESDIGIIFENCSLLTNLRFFEVNILQSEFIRSEKILSKLKFLYVECDFAEGDEFPSYYLTSLLSSPELSQISIRFSDTLTDQVLLDAANRNQFLKLKQLEIVYCHVVTKKGIDVFFNDNNSLKKVDV